MFEVIMVVCSLQFGCAPLNDPWGPYFLIESCRTRLEVMKRDFLSSGFWPDDTYADFWGKCRDVPADLQEGDS